MILFRFNPLICCNEAGMGPTTFGDPTIGGNFSGYGGSTINGGPDVGAWTDFFDIKDEDPELAAKLARGEVTQEDYAKMANIKTLPWTTRFGYAMKANKMPGLLSGAISRVMPNMALTATMAIASLQTMNNGKIGANPDAEVANGPAKPLTEWLKDADFKQKVSQQFPNLDTNSLAKQVQVETDKAVSSTVHPNTGLPTGLDKAEYNQWMNDEASKLNDGTKYRFDRSQEMGLPEWYKQYLKDGSLPDTGENNMNEETEKTTIPDSIQPGLDDYAAKSDAVTDVYNQRAGQLWNDYLEFEQLFFNKNQDIQNQFQNNIANIPNMNLKLPDSMGGAKLPMAPKIHSAMFSDQANTQSGLVNNQANASLAGMGSRNALNNNQFNVNQTNLSNGLLPTQTALDLYKMERASQLGLNNSLALSDANEPSTLSTWAPVVGTLLSGSGDSGKSNLESVWDWGSKIFG